MTVKYLDQQGHSANVFELVTISRTILKNNTADIRMTVNRLEIGTVTVRMQIPAARYVGRAQP